MAPVAELDGDRTALEIIDADHAHRRVNGRARHLSQDVFAIGAGLTPVDSDVTLAPARADTRLLQTLVRFDCGPDKRPDEVVLIALLDASLLGRDLHPARKGWGAVSVAHVEHHMGCGCLDRLGDLPARLRHD